MEIISHNDYQNDFSVSKQILSCVHLLSPSLPLLLSVRGFFFPPFIRIKKLKEEDQVTILLCSSYWHTGFSTLKLETVRDVLTFRTAFIWHR